MAQNILSSPIQVSGSPEIPHFNTFSLAVTVKYSVFKKGFHKHLALYELYGTISCFV